MKDSIKPEEIIEKLGIDGLCLSAEEYFKTITDKTPLMNKPFHSISEGPYLLSKLGVLLSGLRLGKGMTVLDFGAGSCWLSRFLNELSCATISLDPSSTALEIGKELFERLPPLNRPVSQPIFLKFDGKKVPLPDNSLDRIICFDAFHHVPNPDEILEEFYRILKPGGISGFAEVGTDQSNSPQSQKEMKTYNVLENDISLEHIKKVSQDIGFSEIYCKFFTHPDYEINLPDYLRLTKKKKIPKAMEKYITGSMREYPVFFLIKDQYRPDSRNPNGLKHQLVIEKKEYRIEAGVAFTVKIEIENSGEARWLCQNINDTGVVNVGIHLFSTDNQLLNFDFLRFNPGREMIPGDRLELEIPITLKEKGSYRLAFDLVAEQVCWFEETGSLPLSIFVEVI